MSRKRKETFEFRCEKCNEKPEPIKEQSTEQWNVIPVICPKCGGKITMFFK